MTVIENGHEYKVLIANMGTINPGKKLVIDPTYPGVANDFAMTFKRQKEIELDIWVAAHGSHYGLADKHSPGDTYNPETFVDPEGFRAAIDKLEKIYLDQIGVERQ
jgi:metallo-beta-lactamase class B